MNDHDEETLASLQQWINDQLMAKNHALVKALSRATQEMTKTKAQLNQLAGPPMTFATMVRVHSSQNGRAGACSMPAPRSGCRRETHDRADRGESASFQARTGTYRAAQREHGGGLTARHRHAGRGALGTAGVMTAACWSRMAAAT